MKSPKETTVRINVRIPTEQFNKIEEIATIRRISLNSLFLSAIEFYITEGAGKGSNEKYLLSLGAGLKNLKVDIEIMSEMVSFFVLHYFYYTPELPEAQRKALLISGKDRHAKFLELLAKRMQGKGDLVSKISKAGDCKDDNAEFGSSV
jgi:hypothetical protein